MDQDGGYNYPDYEGAYWTEDLFSVSYYKRHGEGAVPEWTVTPAGSEDAVAEGRSAAAVADELRLFAHELMQAADEIATLVPEVGELKPGYQSNMAPYEKALLDELRPSHTWRAFMRHKP